MALALPQFVVLKSNGRYLCPVLGDTQAETYGSLQFSGEDVFDLSAKYEVEVADDGLVHIRCCNNKYWTRRAEDDNRIVAKATEPQIDSNQWSCTLFKPIINGDAQTVRFHHVQLNGYVTVMPSSDIAVSLTEPGVECVFIDWKSLLMLPKHVAFKRNNSRYLVARQNIIDGHNYMQFKGTKIEDQTVRNDVFVTADGYVRIKSHSNGHFWRRDPGANRILADSSDNDTSGNDLFWPVKIGGNVIALRSRGNNLYCKRSARNYFKASAHGIINMAQLGMEETVLSRHIKVVKFGLTDIREEFNDVEVYVSDDIINDSSAESVLELRLSYSKTRRCTWTNGASFSLGVRATIGATIPPCLQARLAISAKISETINWGEEKDETSATERTLKVTVPKNTIMRVTVTATVGTFEIPFWYIQSDMLTNGERVSYLQKEGVYKLQNCLIFKQRNTETKISQN